MPKNKKLALKLGIQTYQILTKDDEVCFPSLSSIFLAVSVSSTGPLYYSRAHISNIKSILDHWEAVKYSCSS